MIRINETATGSNVTICHDLLEYVINNLYSNFGIYINVFGQNIIYLTFYLTFKQQKDKIYNYKICLGQL